MSTVTRIISRASAPAERKPATHLRSVVNNFQTNARPHFYSVGGADRFLIGSTIVSKALGLLDIKMWFAIAWSILMYLTAREIGRSREQASVNNVVASLHNDQDRAALREEMASLRRSKQRRLSRLLEQRGIVV